MKRRWTSISGTPVVLSEDKEHSLGRLNGLFMNPETGQIIAFLVGLTRVLSPVDIEKWGKEFIQISTKEAIVSPTDILRIQEYGLRRSYLNGKCVHSKSNKHLGKVRDFTINTRSNSVLSFDSSKRFLGIEWNKRLFQIKDISEVTDKAILLNFEPEATEKIKEKLKAPAAT